MDKPLWTLFPVYSTRDVMKWKMKTAVVISIFRGKTAQLLAVGAANLPSGAKECIVLLAAKKYNPDEEGLFIK